jgi:Ran GTPase-activating protein (RanGAP) involved in mRNA processing and transport
LIFLEASENFIQGESLLCLKDLASLHTLKLANNKIAKLEDLKPLIDLKNLKNLDLQGNPCQKLADYRKYVLDIMPGLEVLDSFDRQGKEVVSDDSSDYGEEGEEEMEEMDEEEEKKMIEGLTDA